MQSMLAGKIPSANRRALLSSSNPNTGIPANTGTSTGTPNRKYTKWEVTRLNRTKAGLVGSPKLRTLTQANTATTALATRKDASRSIAGNSTRRDAFGSVTGIGTRKDAFGSIAGVNNGLGTTRRNAEGSILGTTNKNFVGVGNPNTPTLNRARNAEGSFAGASGNSIGYDAVKTINNPNRTRQASPSGLVTRRKATQQAQVTAAQGAVNLSHVVTPSAMHRQAVAQEQPIKAQELQFNAGTRNPNRSGINKARSATASKIIRNNKTTGEINTTRIANKSGVYKSKQYGTSAIKRKSANKKYSAIVTRAIKDAGLIEARIGKDTILIDEKEIHKSSLKQKSREKRASKLARRPRQATKSALKQPKPSLRYSKLVRRGA